MCTHNLCFEQKHPKSSAENFQNLQLKKNLYNTWACFRNGLPNDRIAPMASCVHLDSRDSRKSPVSTTPGCKLVTDTFELPSRLCILYICIICREIIYQSRT